MEVNLVFSEQACGTPDPGAVPGALGGAWFKDAARRRADPWVLGAKLQLHVGPGVVRWAMVVMVAVSGAALLM